MSTQRVPIAFVDLSGYITPYNGRITDGLPGKYLYTKEEVEYYYNKQVAADQEKDMQRYGGEAPQVPPPPAPAMSVPPPPGVTMSAPPLPAWRAGCYQWGAAITTTSNSNTNTTTRNRAWDFEEPHPRGNG